jgi:hypothetical protein
MTGSALTFYFGSWFSLDESWVKLIPKQNRWLATVNEYISPSKKIAIYIYFRVDISANI